MPLKKINITRGLVEDKRSRKRGTTKLKRVSELLNTHQLKAYNIRFEKGAKSRLHMHDSDQIIVCVEGKGMLTTFSEINPDDKDNMLKIKDSVDMAEGEAVLIPAGTLHWHGASKKEVSLQFSVMRNGMTFWF